MSSKGVEIDLSRDGGDFWSTVFTSNLSKKNNNKRNACKNLITQNQSVFWVFDIFLHKINFSYGISIPESIFSLFSFWFWYDQGQYIISGICLQFAHVIVPYCEFSWHPYWGGDSGKVTIRLGAKTTSFWGICGHDLPLGCKRKIISSLDHKQRFCTELHLIWNI